MASNMYKVGGLYNRLCMIAYTPYVRMYDRCMPLLRLAVCMVAHGYYDKHASVGDSFFQIARVVNLINDSEQIIAEFGLL